MIVVLGEGWTFADDQNAGAVVGIDDAVAPYPLPKVRIPVASSFLAADTNPRPLDPPTDRRHKSGCTASNPVVRFAPSPTGLRRTALFDLLFAKRHGGTFTALDITHVIRGEDHLTNSAAHIQIFDGSMPRCRPSPIPRCWSTPRMAASASALARCRSQIRAHATWRRSPWPCWRGSAPPIGWSPSPLDALVPTVDLGRAGRAAARFSEDELAHLSARTIHALPHAALREHLPVRVGE